MSDSAQPDRLDAPGLPRIDLRSFLPAPLADRWGDDVDVGTRRAVLMSLNRLLSALTTYLPRHLLHDVLLHPIPGRVHGEFLSSTVLFVDLSGFTAMAERLTVLGREGDETLTSVINDYFTVMSDIAAHHGGDVMLFVGDAMLLLFDGVDHALRACHTAWRMQQAMAARFAEVQTARGTFPLHMAAGLGSGPVFAAALGSAASLHYTVMGPAIVAMGRTAALAGGGQIILDEATRLLAGELIVEALGDLGYARLVAEPTTPYTRPDPPMLDPPPSDERGQIDWLAERVAVVAPFLPTGLLPRLLPDPSAALAGEHRPVTVLFVDFRDADALIAQLGADDPDVILPRLNAAFDAVRSVVARYDGVINKIGAGPAGSHIVAMFGALRSHEDDPARAVQAALDVQSALAGAGLPGLHPPRVGISTGLVYAANVGSRTRREYTVMGDQVNLAARLMSAAEPEQVIVSALTAAHVSHLFDLEERQPVAVRGKSHPQPSSLVRRARRRSGLLPPSGDLRPRSVRAQLIDRAGELRLGYQRIQSAWLGQGQIIAIGGEAGIGKSRLIEALVEYARAEGFDLIGGAGDPDGGDVPYAVWLEPLRALIDLHPTDTDAGRRAKLHAALTAVDRLDDAPIVGDVIGVPPPDSTGTAALDAEALQRRLFETVLGLMRWRARRRPLLCAIDDAHWIDPASRELLDDLARRIGDSAIALLVAYLPEGRWTGWQGLPNAVELALPPLDRAAIEALVADLLELSERRLPPALQTLMERLAAGAPSAAPPDAAAVRRPFDSPFGSAQGKAQGGLEAAFERYWGNPLAAQERVQALIDSGVLGRDASGEWQVTRPIE